MAIYYHGNGHTLDKIQGPLTAEDLPPLPGGLLLGGNALDGVLVRALRLRELSEKPRAPLDRLSAISEWRRQPTADS